MHCGNGVNAFALRATVQTFCTRAIGRVLCVRAIVQALCTRAKRSTGKGALFFRPLPGKTSQQPLPLLFWTQKQAFEGTGCFSEHGRLWKVFRETEGTMRSPQNKLRCVFFSTGFKTGATPQGWKRSTVRIRGPVLGWERPCWPLASSPLQKGKRVAGEHCGRRHSAETSFEASLRVLCCLQALLTPAHHRGVQLDGPLCRRTQFLPQLSALLHAQDILPGGKAHDKERWEHPPATYLQLPLCPSRVGCPPAPPPDRKAYLSADKENSGGFLGFRTSDGVLVLGLFGRQATPGWAAGGRKAL